MKEKTSHKISKFKAAKQKWRQANIKQAKNQNPSDGKSVQNSHIYASVVVVNQILQSFSVLSLTVHSI